jgi:hypothetical protein
MSVPSTGLVVATVLGEEVSFNGSEWTGPEALTELLNMALEQVPTHHYPIDAIAEACMKRAGVLGEIRRVERDGWVDEEEIAGVD